jgi:two-component system, NtrC family, response regulator AtoC
MGGRPLDTKDQGGRTRRDAAPDPRTVPAGLLVVEDDVDHRTTVCEILEEEGYRVETAIHGRDALGRLLAGPPPDLILLDLMMPEMDGWVFIAELHARPDLATIPILVTSQPGNRVPESASIRQMSKPLDRTRLLQTVSSCLWRRVVDAAERALPAALLGESSAMCRMRNLVARAAASDASVLITGESGTGKELVARALHHRGRRAGGPFVAMNCAAVPEALLEGELFGHVRGAFTGAGASRQGLFHLADGGTLFLDEIGELPPSLQPKLLRALQERAVRPLGGAAEIPFDVRLVAATNEDLTRARAERRFRDDLYFRINVIEIEVPPLRERGDDVVTLAHHFSAVYAAMHGKRVSGPSPEATERLLGYSWPGNVRELQNCIERAVALTDRETITVDDLSEALRSAEPRGLARSTVPTQAIEQAGPSLPIGALVPLAEVERRHIRGVIDAVSGNKRLAASILGIDRRTLYRKLEAYGGLHEAPDRPHGSPRRS